MFFEITNWLCLDVLFPRQKAEAFNLKHPIYPSTILMLLNTPSIIVYYVARCLFRFLHGSNLRALDRENPAYASTNRHDLN